MKLFVSEYTVNNNLYVGLQDEEGGLWDLTVNIGNLDNKSEAYIDVNNFPDATDIILQYKLGKVEPYIKQSGFCYYPLCIFDLEKIKS